MPELREELKELHTLAENANPRIQKLTFDMLAMATSGQGDPQPALDSMIRECKKVEI